MERYQQRVIDEKTALRKKIKNLSSFILSDRLNKLPNKEQGLMTMQHKYMLLYVGVLEERIEAFKR